MSGYEWPGIDLEMRQLKSKVTLGVSIVQCFIGSFEVGPWVGCSPLAVRSPLGDVDDLLEEVGLVAHVQSFTEANKYFIHPASKALQKSQRPQCVTYGQPCTVVAKLGVRSLITVITRVILV